LSAKSLYRGHVINCKNSEWFYDNGQPVAGVDKPCGHCGKENTAEGHDGCLGTLNGVMNACCGHGRIADAYVQFTNGKIIDGIDAVNIFTTLH